MAHSFKSFAVLVIFTSCGLSDLAIAEADRSPAIRPSRVPPSLEGPLADYVKHFSAYLLDKKLPEIEIDSWLVQVASKDYVIKGKYLITWSQGDCGSVNSQKTISVPPMQRACAFVTDDRGFGRQAEIIFSVNFTQGEKQGDVKVARIRFHTDLSAGAWTELARLYDLSSAISAHLDDEMAKSKAWDRTIEQIHKEKKKGVGRLIKCATGGKSTRLMVVTENGDIERVKKLIGSGSNINARSIDCEFRIHGSAREDKTALMFAAEKGHVEIARLLIEHGADITAEDTMRGPAWMYAVENGHLEILKLLWEKGAEIIDRHWIISSLYLSCRNRRPDIVEFLAGKIDNPAHLSFPLTCAIQNKDNASAHVLLAHGAQIRADAILAAAFNGDKGILKYFSEIGVSPDMRMNHLGVGVDDATPLMLAAQRGDTTAAALLLEMGANVGAVDAKGWTPLDYAKNGYSLGAKDEAFLKRRQPIIKLLESSKSTPVH